MDLKSGYREENSVDMNTENLIEREELAQLKKINDINNFTEKQFGDLVICTANESHIKEIAELWANLATVQQMFAPERYNYSAEDKNWRIFVAKKLSKTNNLLLVAKNKGEYEIKGFLYLQTITIPSSDLVLKAVIEDIYTKPQYRKQNIGSMMLDVAIDWAKKHNIKQIDLITSLQIKDLSEFYSKVVKKISSGINLELQIL